MDKKKYLEDYFGQLRQIISFDQEKINNLIKTSEILLEANNNGKKTMIFGNGGSAAIASHFSVDLTKNARVRCVNYNESDLLTCFSNDFGYENG
jgi:D-sedoheptulose 7-phosphate isomerase